VTRHSVQTRSVAALTLAAFALTSCGGKANPPGPAKASPISDTVLLQQKDLPEGLDMRISDGKQGPPAIDHTTLAPATKISDADAEQLLARTKPIKSDGDDKQAFALRPNSQPTPRTGQVIKASFPAAASTLLPAKSNETGKDLNVTRYMPEGKVPLAPELSITFSQPMVAVTSQDDAAAVQPVKLVPTPKGRWRWIGTRTLLFDPDVRFPQATTYRVEVPAGTKSLSGGVLKNGVTFTFETPAPTMIASYPGDGPQRLDAPMYALFDQKIDPAAMLSHIKVTAGNQPVAIELLEKPAIKDKQLAAIVEGATKNAQAGRWVAFQATTPFPKATSISVEIGAGSPSAEGPNKTLSAQRFSFMTYPPLAIVEHDCSGCEPGAGMWIRFNNQLDGDKFDDAQFTVSPALPQMKIVQQGDFVMISGATEARTTYKVTVSHALLDAFGQDLDKDTTLSYVIGDPQPTFYGPSGMVVGDPAAAKPTLDFFTTNYGGLKVKLFQVEPDDLDAFGTYMRESYNLDHPPRMPGKKVFDQTVKTTAGANKLVETALDLAPALRHGFGHTVAIVEPSPWTEDYPAPRMVAWVQTTKLGVDAYVDGDNLVGFVTELATGKPAANVELEIRPYGIKGKTDDKGMATLPLGTRSLKGSNYVVAKRGDDTAFVSEYEGWWNEGGSWTKRARVNQLTWYVTDDRRMYKPGEQVTLKGWLRSIDLGKGGDVNGLGGAVSSISYKVFDARNVQIGTGSMPVSAIGGFDTKFALPKTPNLGYARVEMTTQGRSVAYTTHSFQIQEFRRPEFEVTAHASQGPFMVGGTGDITVDAKYYSGGPLPGAPANWSIHASSTVFTPPNRDDFTFGQWAPWWGYRNWFEDGTPEKSPKADWNLAGKTDATGAHTIHLDFLSLHPALPMSVVASASVTDVNRQTWSASQAIIVHPSSLYVGVKAKRPFVEKGQPYTLDVIGVDLDGKAAPGTAIEVRASRLDYSYKNGVYKTLHVEPQTCSVVAAKGPVPCEFKTPVGGQYEVVATIVDAKGRPNQTKLSFWVSGGEHPPAREVSQERVQLIPDKKEYANGDTAEVLVQAPFYPAEAVVSWRRSGIVKVERITMTGPTTTLKVPITEAMVPNMYVQVDLVGMAARTDDKGDPDPKLPKRPAYATGNLNLPVPPKQRSLVVKVSPNAAKIGPGEAAQLSIEVRDANGRAVPNAEAAVIVVDEAVLALSAAQFTDPLDVFYGGRSPDTQDHYSRQYVKLAKPENAALGYRGRPGGGRERMADEAAPMPMPMPVPAAAPETNAPPPPPPKTGEVAKDKSAGSSGSPAATIAVRSNFDALAAFAPSVKTGADGKATVSIKVPDNLTRYRIVAIAVAGDKQFGKGESAITARLPLMVRPSPPRFLNFGDTFRLPVVVQNQTDAPMTVRLAIRATNAAITDGKGREVRVPANERVEVQFPAAAEMAGTARFQIVGSSGTATDAAELALPVWTPATTEAFATYGTIDDGAAASIRQPIALPGKVITQFGGVEVTTASTNLQALTDAFLYIVHYPFECAEQRSSRILAIAALRDVLDAFKTKDMPTRAQLEKSVAEDIEHLSQMQNYDGGYAYWERGHPSDPYLTVYVTNALAHAKAKGFAVPEGMFALAKPYLTNIESHYPWFYSEKVRWAISSYALYTRKQLGDLDLKKAQKLYAETPLDNFTMETVGWLLGTFAQHKGAATERKALVRHILNHTSETAGAANFTSSYGDGGYLLLASDRRVDGVILESLIQEQPDLDLIPKVVTGLLGHRKAGRWINTQENSFALLALDLYFHTYEKTTPDFVARVWLGNDYAGDHAFKGRQTDYYQLAIPMKDVATHDKAPLTIQKDGKGRLYYRIGMTYAPASLKIEPADYGFVVERRYEAVDKPDDVRREKDGSWHIKAGARVRVKLTMVNENRRYHVALVDPMPAGLEPMNAALAVTGPIPQDPKVQQARGAYWWWYGTWYEHQNLRDERVEAFASLLWEGVHEYSYVARATTPGTFVVPPPKAEEMYMPETFGRGGTDRVIVE